MMLSEAAIEECQSAEQMKGKQITTQDFIYVNWTCGKDLKTLSTAYLMLSAVNAQGKIITLKA
jgi:hypothetical protein